MEIDPESLTPDGVRGFFSFLREPRLGRGWSENRAAILTLRFTLVLVTSFALLSGETSSSPLTLGLIALLFASQLWLGAMPTDRFSTRAVQIGLALGDLAAITAAISLTDEASGELFAAYFLLLLVVSLSGSLRRVAAVTAGACAAYALGVWLTHDPGEPWRPAVLVHLPLLFVTGMSFGLMAQSTRDEHTALVESEHERVALEAVLDLSERLNASLDADAVVRTVSQRLVALVPRARLLNVIAEAPGADGPARMIRVDASADGQSAGAALDDGAGQPDPQSLASVPMLLHDRVVGAMVVSANPPLSASELRVARVLANVATHALVNSALYGTVAEAAERFRRLEAEHRRVLEGAEDWIAVYRVDGTVVSWNRGAERITGVPRAEAVGARIDRFFPPGADLSWFLRTLGRGTVHTGLESVRIRSDGTERFLVSTLSPLPLEGNDEPRILEIGKDLTEQRALSARLDQVEKISALGNVISGVAHELNNPLTTVLLCARALQRSRDVNGEHLDLIIQEAQRAARIVADLLTYARPPHDEHRPVDLAEAIRRAVRSFKGATSASTPTVNVHVDGILPEVKGSVREIEQALINLLRNGLQAMEGIGELTVRAYRSSDGSNVSVDVQDEGPGVPAGIRKKIFEPFFTTKAPGEGTGLGLSLVQRVMLSHRGAVEIDDRPGGGAIFRLRFPIPASASSSFFTLPDQEMPRA